MKNKILGLALGSVLAVGLMPATAFAWHYALSGSGVCLPNGTYQISWEVDNSTEPEPLVITNSSNTSVVAIGETVPAHEKEIFGQNVPGNVPGVFTLTLEGNWASDQNKQSHTDTVTLQQACEQPTTPPVTPPQGGRGGEEPTVMAPAVTVAAAPAPAKTPVKPPQVEAPVGGVGAGSGSQDSGNTAAIGLISSLSLAAAGLGLRRFNKES